MVKASPKLIFVENFSEPFFFSYVRIILRVRSRLYLLKNKILHLSVETNVALLIANCLLKALVSLVLVQHIVFGWFDPKIVTCPNT